MLVWGPNLRPIVLREKRHNVGKLIRPVEIEIARKGISNWIGWPQNIIKPRHVSMEPLVHSKETKEVRGGGVGGGTPPVFLKGSAEIVSFGQHSLLPDIKTLAEGIKVEEAACKLQI